MNNNDSSSFFIKRYWKNRSNECSFQMSERDMVEWTGECRRLLFTRIHLRIEQLLTTIDCHFNELRTSIIHLYEDTREKESLCNPLIFQYEPKERKKAILFISYIWRCIWPSWLNSNFIISQFAEVFFFIIDKIWYCLIIYFKTNKKKNV